MWSHLVLAAALAQAEPAVPGPAALDSAAPGAAAPLRAIEVEGNHRTAREVVVRALGVRLGDPVAAADVPALRQRVANLKIFRDVEVRRRAAASGSVLEVAVQERWTLIPIPIVGASDGAARVGLALLESNLVGRHKLLAVAGIYSSRGQTGFALYKDPATFGTRAVLTAELLAQNEEHQRARGLDVVYAWRERSVDASVRPGVRLGPRLAVRAGPFVLARSTRAADGDAPPRAGGTNWGVSADLEYLGQDFRDWFEAGPLLRVRGRTSLPALGSERRFTQAMLEGAWSAPVPGGPVVSLSVQGFLADGDRVLDAYRLGARPGSRGVREDGLWAERAATATLDGQIPVWRPRWGTVAALAFVDAGASAWGGERARWIAPGAGWRVYVRDVALPALGFDVAWSNLSRAVTTSFFLGFGT